MQSCTWAAPVTKSSKESNWYGAHKVGSQADFDWNLLFDDNGFRLIVQEGSVAQAVWFEAEKLECIFGRIFHQLSGVFRAANSRRKRWK